MDRYQVSTATTVNRYTNTLATIGTLFPRDAELRILVFGGSIGLEALTMSRIFPKARVVSMEISPKAHRVACRVREAEPRILPRLSDLDSLKRMSSFDIVMAHSVLCDHPGALTKDRFTMFDFQSFESILAQLIDRLNPEGVLSLINASYCIEDSALYHGFHKIGRFLESTVPKFDPQGLKIAQVITNLAGPPDVQIASDRGADHVKERLLGALLSRRPIDHTPPPSLLCLTQDDFESGEPQVSYRTRATLPGFVRLATRIEFYDLPPHGSIASRLALVD